MRQTALLTLALALALASCKGKEPAKEPTDKDKPGETKRKPVFTADDAAVAFKSRRVDFFKSYLESNPQAASGLGYHEFDGKLGDISPEAISAELSAYKKALADFEAMNMLSSELEYERQILLSHIRSVLFDHEVQRAHQRNPMRYPWALNLTRYISRDYAPVADRARAIISTCGQAEAYFAQAQKNLEETLPRPMVETALLQANGTISFIKNDVIPALTGLGDADKVALEKSLETCARAMTGYRDFLLERKKTTTEEFAIGAEAFLRMLAGNEGLEIDIDRLEAIGKADLERNLAALAKAAEAIAPGKPIPEAVAMVAADKPAPDKVLAEATGQSAAMKKFLVDNKIVSIPSEDKAEVRTTPAFMRWNFAFLSTPGAFEKKSLPSFYYITPPDPTWSKKMQNDYVASRSDLLFVTVHEVWPGHFLHHLHAKKSASSIARAFCTYSMGEGWAHYTEEMMWDAGVGAGDPKVHVGQLQNALLRNVRFVSAIGLHTKDMTVEESKKLFIEKGMQDEGNAMQQATRGTFDPGYLNYTLGKLMIKKLHDDWKAKQGDAYAIGKFHDEFLRYQCAPVPVIRRLMLGRDAGPAL